ncbi:hypothetical protein [Falsiroseomonas sp.]|uniref:hypothetical protein n=1 Tax=Falsiroseomonas sp. TaxID=2870721 RepID=UPI003F6F2EAF
MTLRPPRALFGNAGFVGVAGSELVLLEAAEELIGRGWHCDLATWYAADPMAGLARQAGLRLLPKVSEARPFTYDLVWLQSRQETVLDYALDPAEAERTLFAFAHLDRDWALAQPGVVAERVLGQVFIVTVEAARARIAAGGLPRHAIRLSHNAAPAAFEMPPPPPRAQPGTLLLVSNHLPPEVAEAARLLRAEGMQVVHWGQEGEVRDRRLMPADLAAADAVVSIGKTIPYALRARRAAYVYDHFGGPGWLREANFAAVAERNFSGLCCERRLDGAAIAAEILQGYAGAARDAAARDAATLAPYRLEGFMDEVLAMLPMARTPAQHRKGLARHLLAIRSERHLARGAGTYYARVLEGLQQQKLAREGVA